MKHLFAKWLSALLIASLLMSGTALMEEALPVTEEPVETFAAEPVEEEAVSEETIELSEEEVLPAFEADVQEEVVEEEQPDESAKLMEGETLIPIDEAHFPDAAFRQYVAAKFDTDGDGSLSDYERQSVGGISNIGDNTTTAIASMQGIEYFTNLEEMHWAGSYVRGASSDGLISLDVSGMPNLRKVYCACNRIETLNFSNCPNLVELMCYSNKLTSLVVQGCPKLEHLECHNNKLTSLTFADNCPNLKYLDCYLNNLSVLDLSNQPEFVARWKSWKYKIKEKKTTWTAIRRTNPPEQFYYDNKTKIITAADTVSAESTAFAEVPGATNATVTVAEGSTAASTTATVVAAPGAKAQLDLSGASGKTFKSSNKKIATVNKNGTVTFKKAGKVKITYKVGKKTCKVTLNITDPTLPTSVTIEPVATEVKKGDSVTLTATLSEGANSGIKWTSSNKKVATVNKSGVVTFKKAGKVTITATTTRGKKKAKMTFTVSK